MFQSPSDQLRKKENTEQVKLKSLIIIIIIQTETSLLHRAIVQADHATPLRLRKQELHRYHKTDEYKMRIWKEKLLHGRHPNEVTQDYVFSGASNYWLTTGKMFPETEGLLLAIQEQVISTRSYLKYIYVDMDTRPRNNTEPH